MKIISFQQSGPTPFRGDFVEIDVTKYERFGLDCWKEIMYGATEVVQSPLCEELESLYQSWKLLTAEDIKVVVKKGIMKDKEFIVTIDGISESTKFDFSSAKSIEQVAEEVRVCVNGVECSGFVDGHEKVFVERSNER